MITQEQADKIRHLATMVTTTRRQHFAADQAVRNLRTATPVGEVLDHYLTMLLNRLKSEHNDAVEMFQQGIREITE